jgi:hypothetical protein
MVNHGAEVDRLLRDSLHVAGDRWEPDQNKALREIRARSERRVGRRLCPRLMARLQRFRSRALVLAAAMSVLALASLLGPGAVQALRDAHEDSPRQVAAGPTVSSGTPSQKTPGQAHAVRRPVSLTAGSQRLKGGRPAPHVDEGLSLLSEAGDAPWAFASEMATRHAEPSTAATRRAMTQRLTRIEFGPDVVGVRAAATVLRTVPDILNLAPPVARDRLQQRGLQVRLIAEPSEGGPVGDVVTRQYPTPGQKVPVNAAVTLMVRTSCPPCLQAQGAIIAAKAA